ncbi:hypothetical protein V6Z11_A11G349800 [Gossypium hirsutum]
MHRHRLRHLKVIHENLARSLMSARRWSQRRILACLARRWWRDI